MAMGGNNRVPTRSAMSHYHIITAVALMVFVTSPARSQGLSADPSIWPNTLSRANSDPWLAANHDRLRQMRPRVMVINFANGLSAEKGQAQITALIHALQESSRYHGYEDKAAPPFLVYEIAKVYGKSRFELLSIQAQGVFKALRDGALRTGSEAPEKAQAAVALAREAAVELLSIAKEKGPGAAEAALGKAKAKLGQVLPMFKADKAAEDYAVAAE